MIWHPRHQPALAALALALLALGLYRWSHRPAAAPAPGASGDLASTRSFQLDPNTATEPELAIVPGIGRSRARAIVQAREAEMTFRTMEDLDFVKGVGESTLYRAAPYLRFPPP